MNGDRSETTETTDRFSRRAFLATSTVTAVGLAGCLDDSEDPDTESGSDTGSSSGSGDGSPPRTARVENPPDAVYLPTHSESVTMLDPIQTGEYMLLPHFTSQHRFWLLRGNDDQPERTVPNGAGLHFMFAVWDGETGSMLPVDIGLEMTLRRDGQLVDRRQPWPMISQTMGFHFGDNVQFPEPGTYDIEVGLNPIDSRKTGSFSDRFTDATSTEFTFEFSRDVEVQAVENVEYLDEDRWGEPGALEPMDSGGGMDGSEGMDRGMGHPGVSLPAADEYPGTDLGVYTSGDAEFVVRTLPESRLTADGEDYLFVSPRTPYNRVPLPDMSLSVEGDIQGELTQTIDSDLGHHYGSSVDLATGDTFDLVVETPPQVARHRGYETAFLDMPPMTVEMS